MSEKSITLEVEGMTCVNCAQTLEKYLSGKGFKSVQVNFAGKDVSFVSDEAQFNPDEVAGDISKLGFRVISKANPAKTGFSIDKKVIISAILTAPLFLGHMLMWVNVHALHFLHIDWVQLLFALPVYLIGVHQFGRSSWFALRQGVIHMDVLIFMGSSAAFFYSLAGTISGNADMIFYETAAMIITLVLLGNYLEQRAVKQTTTAIEALSTLQPESALKYEGNQLVKVPAKSLKVHDLLQVNEGDKVPADGIITEGEAYVDESMLTGESEPVFKKSGDAVVGASVLVKGQFKAKVTAAVADSVLQNIIRLVKQAQADKPDIQRLADKISGIFVPLVLIIAVLTLLISFYAFDIPFTRALMNSIAVLVISCPCAMGLATPTAVMVGLGKVAGKGILIRGGSTLEEFADAKYMLFDKTGTLTTGTFRISDIDYDGNDKNLVDALIYRMEEKSSHPLASAIRKHLNHAAGGALPVNLITIEEIGGKGLRAVDSEQNEYFLGNADRSTHATAEIPDYDVVLLQNDIFVAGFNVTDDLKTGARSTVDYLKSLGITPVIISGDKRRKVQETAAQLGIEAWHASQSPSDKLQLVDSYRQQGRTIMVGDGINDAPALAKADLGVSLSNASEVAIQSSKIVLLGGDISHLEHAMKISKATLTTIRQNLGWAFSYNLVAIPIAAMGYLNPMWAAFFMGFSDIMVIGNSIRLKFRKL